MDDAQNEASALAAGKIPERLEMLKTADKVAGSFLYYIQRDGNLIRLGTAIEYLATKLLNQERLAGAKIDDAIDNAGRVD